MKRLFFALWPDDSVRQQCVDLINSLACTAKPVNPGNLHVTLCFVGSVDSEIETALLQEASACEMVPISLTFDRISFWQAPKVVCLTSSKGDLAAALLADRLADLARNLGISLDERSFTPHITLFRGAKEGVKTPFKPILWCADSFYLVQSCSTVSGVEYRVLKQWPTYPDFNPLRLA